MLRNKLSLLPAALVLALLAMLIGAVPVGASSAPVGPRMPGLHGAVGAPGAPPVSGTHAPASRVHAVPAVGCSAWTQVSSPNPSGQNSLYGVVAPSKSLAWAVGNTYNGGQRTLIEQWNGSAWSQVSSPSPGSGENYLSAVDGDATSAWAVGWYSNGPSYIEQTLIEQWNGSSWNVVKSPSPGSTNNELYGVVGNAKSAWAVGYSYNGSTFSTLILQWNGSTWTQVPSPNPGSQGNFLHGVDGNATSAWATGYYGNSEYSSSTLILRWNGSAWTQVPSPNPGPQNNNLGGGMDGTAKNAWAVGSYNTGRTTYTLIEQWNGSSWSQAASPSPGAPSAPSYLSGVAGNTKNAWAVGSYFLGSIIVTLTEQWNGSSWNVVKSPNPGSVESILQGVAQVGQSGHFWSVGSSYNGSTWSTLILQC
jgi:hypothetical protein